jgi:hypothetical protein
MARHRREINVFSLSFLDAISCGFGAVVLLFMIINANVDLRSDQELEDLSGEVNRAELKVLTGRKNLVQLKADLARMVEEWATLQGMRDQLVTEIRETVARATTEEQESEARRAAIERLRSELAELEAETKRLSAAGMTTQEAGTRIRGFAGEGNRQYLTGMRMGGRRVVVLVDTSTSMLDRTIVNILRRRNMSPEQQRVAPKWLQAVNTVDWLTTQIAPGTQVQIIGFSSEAKSLVPGTDGQWITVTDGSELETAVQSLRNSYPKGPTSLHAAFNALRALEPKPDNVYLLVDGLPTMGEIIPTRSGVTGRERLDHYNRAVRQLPLGVPVNVILFAMEGDPEAAPAYWVLALRTGGSMLAPSEDWP